MASWAHSVLMEVKLTEVTTIKSGNHIGNQEMHKGKRIIPMLFPPWDRHCSLPHIHTPPIGETLSARNKLYWHILILHCQ